MAKNVGEYDEMRIKLRLIELRDAEQPIVIDGQELHIQSVKMGEEFSSLPIGTDLTAMSNAAIEKLAKSVGASKAPTGAKADVCINSVGYSVKSHRSAPPALVNHTPRWGWKRICDSLKVDITPLDEIVAEYFRLRSAGAIGEDVSNDNPLSPFANHKNYLRPILNYFLFTGTGVGDSKYPANYVLDCADPYDVSTWKLYDHTNYLDLVWDRLVFSMRNKGFNPKYTRPNDLWKNAACSLWAHRFDGSIKGSLHVRAK